VRYIKLGRTGLDVSPVAIGAMTYGEPGRGHPVWSLDEEASRPLIQHALEAGINFFDTANMYSYGSSEEILGRALRDFAGRDDVVIATKLRHPMRPGPNGKGLSRKAIMAEVDHSLERLGTDYIDLYQVHQWDGQTPLEETMSALSHLVDAGKVRYVGVSNFSAWHVMKAIGVADRRGFHPIVSQQINYSLQAREAEYELLPVSVDQGVGVLVWSPLAGGLLSGKYRRGVEPPAGSRQLTDWNEPPVPDREKLYDTVEVLVEVADAHGVSAAQVALAWTLTRPAVSSLIIGARTSEQLADNLAAADLVLAEDEIARLEEVSRPTLLYPYWHQAAAAGKRLGAADLTFLGRHLED
jgi:aryl-alcohol dehydrogenase-like predicted oxidoreductase